MTDIIDKVSRLFPKNKKMEPIVLAVPLVTNFELGKLLEECAKLDINGNVEGSERECRERGYTNIEFSRFS